MTGPEGVLPYPRLRAPQEDGQRLLEPPLSIAPQRMEANRSRQSELANYDLHGRALADLALDARRQMLEAARSYTAADGVSLPAVQDASAPVLMTGHQPDLYHAGVWFKNFVLGRLAAQVGGQGVQLLIDNDLVRETSLRVPAGSAQQPHLASVDYDEVGQLVPHEERAIHDPARFATFADRVAETLSPLVAEPMISPLWPGATAAAAHRRSLGECLAAGRRHLERQWGLVNWELPLSAVCRQTPFCWFLLHLLARLDAFHQIHNASLREYRRLHRVRSSSHPVPELRSDGEWLEAPFWIWTSDAPLRRSLFVRRRATTLELSDRASVHWTLPLPVRGDAHAAVDEIVACSAERKLRPRALITTMFARVFLSDLFIHGIGGAKYDELTDRLIQRFFGLTPPAFMIVTATAKLPIPRRAVRSEQLNEIQQRLRQLDYQPDRWVERNATTEALMAEKQRWLTGGGATGDRRRRHQEITRINSALQPFLALQRRELLDEQQRLKQLLRRDRLLGSREFAFCLFPEKTLRPFLLDF